MTTTQEQVGVGFAGLAPQTPAEIADVLTGMTLGMRAMWLPKSENNVEAIPHSDPAALNIAREMGQGRSQEWKRLMTKKLCDQKDGVPTDALITDLEYAIAVLRSSAPALRVDRPLPALNAAETKAQARLDLAQFRLAEQPNDPTAIRDALSARDHYATVFGEFTASLRHRLAVHRGPMPPRRFVGRRRSLALHA